MRVSKFIVGICLVLATVAVAQQSDVVTVKGVGVGVDEIAALKDAYRDAIETAVGLYVDAEQMEENEELIKDQILTQSNAYIEGYKLAEKNEKDGLVRIKIMARVRKQALTRKISGVMPSVTVSIGDSLQNLHAREITEARRNDDGAKILANALDDVNPVAQMYNLSIVNAKGIPVGDGSEDVVAIDYLFKMEVDSNRYFNEFLPDFVRALEQISVGAPKTVRFIVRGHGPEGLERDQQGREYLEASECLRNQYVNPDYGSGCVCGRASFDTDCIGAMRGRTCVGLCMDEEEGLKVVVIEKANKTLSLIRGRIFTIDRRSAQSVSAWRKKMDASAAAIPSYVISFVDVSGETVAEQVIKFPQLHYYDVSCEGLFDFWSMSGGNTHTWLISPWFAGDAQCYYQWFRFRLPKDDLPRINSIRVELAQ